MSKDTMYHDHDQHIIRRLEARRQVYDRATCGNARFRGDYGRADMLHETDKIQGSLQYTGQAIPTSL